MKRSLLPILALPISVALSFIPMVFLDIPSTIMSLGGIAIAIGATVDAVIVMVEAAHKKLEHAGPDADRHMEMIKRFEDAGYTHTYVHQIGPDQQGFLDFYKREILPNFS
jgi:Cu/Ag efflux pump CusA